MPIEQRLLSIPSGELTLEAVLHLPGEVEPAGILVVCHPHPLYGGSMDNNVVFALCEAALQEGLAALRFNFRGVGASSGSFAGGEGEGEDARAVLSAAAELPGGATLALAGYSFGAGVAAGGGCAGPTTPSALVLVSPPLRSLSVDGLRACPPNRLLVCGDLDSVCPAAELEELAGRLQPRAECAIVEGATHSWLGYESELRDIVGSFLRWQAAAPSR